MNSKNKNEQFPQADQIIEQSPKSSTNSSFLHLSNEAIEALKMLKKLKLSIPHSNSNSEGKSLQSLKSIQLQYIQHRIIPVKNYISSVAPYKVDFIRSVMHKEASPTKTFRKKNLNSSKFRTPKENYDKYPLIFQSHTPQPGKYMTESQIACFNKENIQISAFKEDKPNFVQKLNFNIESKVLPLEQNNHKQQLIENEEIELLKQNEQIHHLKQNDIENVKKNEIEILIEKKKILLDKRIEIDNELIDITQKLAKFETQTAINSNQLSTETGCKNIVLPKEKQSRSQSKERRENLSSRVRSLYEKASVKQEKLLIDEKMLQIKREEEQLKECTFKPKINSKGSFASIQERQKHWLKEKNKKIGEKLQQQEEKEMRECTFAPQKSKSKINSKWSQSTTFKSNDKTRMKSCQNKKMSKLQTPSPIKRKNLFANISQQKDSDKLYLIATNSDRAKFSQQIQFKQSQNNLNSIEKDIKVKDFGACSTGNLIQQNKVNVEKIDSKYQQLIEVYTQLKQLIYAPSN